MWRAVEHYALVADLDPDRVEEDQRVGRIERPLLPGGDLVEYGVGHRADQVGRHVNPVQIVRVPGDLAGAHAGRVHRHDLVIEAWKTRTHPVKAAGSLLRAQAA